MTLQLRHETPDDMAAIEAVTVAAFAEAAHTSHTEQFIVCALRAANELTLSIVAEEHGQVVGHARTEDVTKDEVLGMIILGKVPPKAIAGPGAMQTA